MKIRETPRDLSPRVALVVIASAMTVKIYSTRENSSYSVYAGCVLKADLV